MRTDRDNGGNEFDRPYCRVRTEVGRITRIGADIEGLFVVLLGGAR